MRIACVLHHAKNAVCLVIPCSKDYVMLQRLCNVPKSLQAQACAHHLLFVDAQLRMALKRHASLIDEHGNAASSSHEQQQRSTFKPVTPLIGTCIAEWVQRPSQRDTFLPDDARKTVMEPRRFCQFTSARLSLAWVPSKKTTQP